MKKDDHLISEAYFNSSTKLRAVKNAKLIYFIDDDEVYAVDPYKQVDKKTGLSDQEISKWIPCDLVIGEDVMDFMPDMKGVDSSAWYIADQSIPGDHTFKALVGYR
jgi:hypothetical protein